MNLKSVVKFNKNRIKSSIMPIFILNLAVYSYLYKLDL